MSRTFTVCERETRIAIKEGARTVGYVQMAADDEETANLFAAAPALLSEVIATRAMLEAIEAHIVSMARPNGPADLADEGKRIRAALKLHLSTPSAAIAIAEGRS